MMETKKFKKKVKGVLSGMQACTHALCSDFNVAGMSSIIPLDLIDQAQNALHSDSYDNMEREIGEPRVRACIRIKLGGKKKTC